MGFRMDPKQLEEYVRRTGKGGEHLSPDMRQHIEKELQPPAEAPTEAGKCKTAPGQTRRGQPNKTEQRFYDEIIWPQVAAGEIIKARYEEQKFKIGERSWYTTDWGIVYADELGRQKTYCEIKGGHIRDAGKRTFKTAALLFPEYRWQLWQYTNDRRWVLLLEF